MREALRTIGFAFCTAAFLWGFYLVQHQLAYLNFKNGVQAGINYCTKPGNTLPQGDMKVHYLGEQADTGN
jgi:hypothetical protein